MCIHVYNIHYCSFTCTAVHVFTSASAAVESQRSLRLRFEKTGIIATDLTIAVQLLTVANATELGLPLPIDLPSDDPYSPNRAESTYQYRILFEYISSNIRAYMCSVYTVESL